VTPERQDRGSRPSAARLPPTALARNQARSFDEISKRSRVFNGFMTNQPLPRFEGPRDLHVGPLRALQRVREAARRALAISRVNDSERRSQRTPTRPYRRVPLFDDFGTLAGRTCNAASLVGCPASVDGIQRHLGDRCLGVTSIFLQGIDPDEIIPTVHGCRPPMIPASVGLALSRRRP
jgi:hypothetical protein